MDAKSLKEIVSCIKEIESREWIDDATPDYKRGFEKAIMLLKFELFGIILENHDKLTNK